MFHHLLSEQKQGTALKQADNNILYTFLAHIGG